MKDTSMFTLENMNSFEKQMTKKKYQMFTEERGQFFKRGVVEFEKYYRK